MFCSSAIVTLFLIIECLQLEAQSTSHPVQLVAPDSGHQNLVLLEENLHYLESIQESTAVISVVGPFHSGKSFLLNSLLGVSQNGFQLGEKVDPQTKGIWMWSEPLKITNSEGHPLAVVVLDTEGFYYSNISEIYDAKIFSITTLLSSYLIYNTIRIIDQASIENLELLARRTQLFHLRAELERYEDIPDFLSFPKLLWVVRDFVQDTGELTPTEWLHSLLHSRRRDAANEDARISLLSLFPMIEAFTLSLPAGEKRILRRLDLATDTTLSEDYKRDMEQLRRKVFTSVTPKMKGDMPLTGPALASLLRFFIAAANDGKVPILHSAWDSFLQQQAIAAETECVRIYRHNTSSLEMKTTAQLHAIHAETKQRLLRLVRQMLIGLENLITSEVHKIESILEEEFQRLLKENEQKIAKYCENVYENVYETYQREMKAVPLPTKRTALQQLYHEKSTAAIVAYEQNTTQFADTKPYLFWKQLLQRDLESLRAQMSEQNTELLNKLLVNGIQEAKKVYIQHATLTEAVAQNTLNEIDEKAKHTATKVFEMTAVAEDEPSYPLYVKQFHEEIKSLSQQLRVENEKLAEKAMSETVKSQLAKIRTEMNNIQLPTSETAINNAIEASRTFASQHFTEAHRHLSYLTVYTTSYQALLTEIEKLGTELHQRNVKRLKEVCDDVLAKVYRRLEKEADSFWFGFSFRWHAERVCDEHLASRIAEKSLRKKVTTDFIEQELNHLVARITSWQSWLLYSILVVILFGILGTISSWIRSDVFGNVTPQKHIVT